MTFAGTTGATLSLTHTARNESPAVARNEDPVDWSKGRYCYRAGSLGRAPIQQSWLGGELRVSAGKSTFTSRVDANGTVSWR